MKEIQFRQRKSTVSTTFLSITLLAVLCFATQGEANNQAVSQSIKSTGLQFQNHNKFEKSRQSARKEAAKRLKALHQQKLQKKLHDWASLHHGYNGLGHAGDGSVSNIQPATTGGAQ